MRTRVLFVDHTATLGGGEIALLNLVEQLDPDRYTPIVVLFSDGPLASRLIRSGIATYILPLDPKIVDARKESLGGSTLLRWRKIACTLGFVRKLARFIRVMQVDIVHTNSLKADLIGGLAARLALRPLVWHVRDRIDDDYLPRTVACVFRRLARALPHRVIANSQATLDTLWNGRGPGQPTTQRGEQHMCVVHDGVLSGAAPVRRPRKAASPPPRIGLVGRMSHWKGQHIFLRAAVKVRERFPDAQFQIVGAALFGEEDYEREIRLLADKLGLSDCLEFTGFRHDVPRLIADMDVLVHASICGEPFGQVVVEGMIAGKPVVAANGGGVPEIVDDGVTGLLVPMDDSSAMAEALCRLLADPDAARRMGRAGRERAQDHFSMDKTARGVERVYETLLQPARLGGGRPMPRPNIGVAEPSRPHYRGATGDF